MSALLFKKLKLNDLDEYYIKSYEKYRNFKYFGIGSNIDMRKIYAISILDEVASNAHVCSKIDDIDEQLSKLIIC